MWGTGVPPAWVEDAAEGSNKSQHLAVGLVCQTCVLGANTGVKKDRDTNPPKTQVQEDEGAVRPSRLPSLSILGENRRLGSCLETTLDHWEMSHRLPQTMHSEGGLAFCPCKG